MIDFVEIFKSYNILNAFKIDREFKRALENNAKPIIKPGEYTFNKLKWRGIKIIKKDNLVYLVQRGYRISNKMELN